MESLRENDRSGLGLPIGVDHGALLVTDVLPVPVPGLFEAVSEAFQLRMGVG